jgi:hypothetical protein
MAPHIRDETVREIAVELARRRSSSVTGAVRAALLEAKARLEREHGKREAESAGDHRGAPPAAPGTHTRGHSLR